MTDHHNRSAGSGHAKRSPDVTKRLEMLAMQQDYETDKNLCLEAISEIKQLRAPAQAEQVRAATIEECARVAGNYPSSGSATEHPVEYWIRALASQPSPAATVETEVADLRCLVATYANEATEAKAELESLRRCSAESEVAKLREEVEKWHRVAMEAGAITCVGGGHIYPLRDEVKKLRAQVVSLTATEPQGASVPTVSAMQTALRYMQLHGARLEKDATKVSGAGEGAEIYRDAAKCIEFALSLSRPQSEPGK